MNLECVPPVAGIRVFWGFALPRDVDLEVVGCSACEFERFACVIRGGDDIASAVGVDLHGVDRFSDLDVDVRLKDAR
jgi:hypothetical protein